MILRKYAAIDIGSNAVRLLINNVIEKEGQSSVFRKNKLIRAPVRLGEDAFVRGSISDRNLQRLVKAMQSFQLLMQVYEVEKYSAHATSALREADNRDLVVATVLKETGISIEIIDGSREAAIIAATDLKNLIRNDKTYLYVDIGGGSTELTLFEHGILKISKSFKIGTLRLLHHLVSDDTWESMRHWIATHCPAQHTEIIGSGGNINKLHKVSGKKPGQSLSYIDIQTQYGVLTRMTYHERIVKLGLNPDRADVIVPATHIMLQVAKWSSTQAIHAPKIGLADGMIKML